MHHKLTNQNEAQIKSAMLIETKGTFLDKSNIPLNSEVFQKRNNRYYDKSCEKDPRTIYKSVSRSNKRTSNKTPNNSKKPNHSTEQKQGKNHKIIEKFDNIFEKNQNYLYKNKNNYEETLKKICGFHNINNNEFSSSKVYSPTLKGKEVDTSFRWAGNTSNNKGMDKLFENPVGLIKIKMHEHNYEESMEKIDLLYKKNDMAIRDYIKIKDNLNIVCLVRNLFINFIIFALLIYFFL